MKKSAPPQDDDDDLDDFMDLAGSFAAKAQEPEKEVKAEHKVVGQKQKQEKKEKTK